MTFRKFVRPMFVALSLAFATTAAAPAFADSAHGKSAEHKGQGKAHRDDTAQGSADRADDAHAKAEGKGKSDGANAKGKAKAEEKAKAPKFPIGADKFEAHVEARLTSARAKLVSALAKHKVADATQTKILKDFDDSAALVRAAAKRAASDKEVTKAEAKEVRGLVKTLREQMRAKYAPKKGRTDKSQAKDV